MPLEGSVQPAPGVDAGVFRQVIGHFMSGVAVITASHEGTHRGMTVSAIASLSLDPPMIVACLNAASSTQEVVRRAGVFAVNVLAEDQGDLAERFARRGADPFDGLDYALGVTGAPVFPGALAVLECRIAQEVRGRVAPGAAVRRRPGGCRGRNAARLLPRAGSGASSWRRTLRRTSACGS